MKLSKDEKELLIKILEEKLMPFEREDLVSMIRGPLFKMKIETLYDDVFRKHMKYDVGILNEKEVLEDNEREILEAIWKKVWDHFEELFQD